MPASEIKTKSPRLFLVASQSPASGKKLPADAKVAVKLVSPEKS
jgi:hypothetical protein